MKSKTLLHTICCTLLFMVAFSGNTYAWGTDVNVNSVPGRFYKNVKVSVSFDGTIFVGRLYAASAAGPYQNWEVLKSTDNGVTFSAFIGGTLGSTNRYTSFDIIAAGQNATDFRLYVARPYIDTVSNIATLRVYKYNIIGASTSLSFDNENYTSYTSERGFDYLSWATDSRMPALNSSPYNITLVVSKASNND